MNFKITVHDSFFNKDFSGIFQAKTKEEAILQAKLFYSAELDTSINFVVIKEITKYEN